MESIEIANSNKVNISTYEHNKFLQILDKYKVDYLLVTPEKYTKDEPATLWLKPTEINKQKLMKAMSYYGYQGDMLRTIQFPQYLLSQDITLPLKNEIKITGRLSNDHNYRAMKLKSEVVKGRNDYPVRAVSVKHFEKSKSLQAVLSQTEKLSKALNQSKSIGRSR